MDNVSAIQKHIDNRPVRHLDRDRDDAGLARDRLDPVRQLGQSGAAVPEFTLSRDAAEGVENAGLVLGMSISGCLGSYRSVWRTGIAGSAAAIAASRS
jgi:hypothetical protein